ncbi:MAG: response regulator [Mangrovicoccus sp.]
MKKFANVMVIDDEQVDQLMLRRVLAKTELAENIITFTYAEDALGYLRDHLSSKPDLIFVDINMPRMSGIEFLEEMNDEISCDYDPPIIVLTTSAAPQDRARVEEFPSVREFMIKPLRMDTLTELSKRLMHSQVSPHG